LTNDAVQKFADDYGKHESGNKLSYDDFQRYINQSMPKDKQVVFAYDILPQIKEMVRDTVKATFMKLDKHGVMNTFELLGYDFMIDADWKPYIIEVNTNPCLALSSSYLARLIPELVENTF
jgi:D-alanine-D-alanine ligase-like ATP-grasp enzyme